jgi:hypothetical protein
MTGKRKLLAIVCAVAISGLTAFAQEPLPPPQATPPLEQAPPPAQPLSPQQLDDLVAPIALYPDPLLSQILVASTYPLEVVEAFQWSQQNRNLTPQQQVDAARQQNWDPSVQALVAFPDVLAMLNQDVQWTTALGNAFLAEQADVMNAVQRMRLKAMQNGKLQSTPQQSVTEQTENGQTAIDIEPTNPQVVYVPTYNPDYIWGSPDFGYYPPLYYPGIGFGFGFGPGIYVGGFFGGCCGWGAFGWGWGPNWFGHSILVNNYFFHRYGYGEFHGGFRGTSVWAHNPAHRMGVPYPNHALNNEFRAGNIRGAGAFRGGAVPQFNGGANFRGAPSGNFRGFSGGAGVREPAPRAGGFSSPGFSHSFSGVVHSAFGGIHNGGQTRIESDHGFSSMGHFGGGFRGGGGFHGGGARGGRR